MAIFDAANRLDGFNQLRSQVEKIPSDLAERVKPSLFLQDPGYVDFLRKITNTSRAELEKFSDDWQKDDEFFFDFTPKLEVLHGLEHAGDLRFHSFSLYAIVRAFRPNLVVETGVAHGKSSAAILLGLHHNQHGRLFSWDLPPEGPLLDGSLTSMDGHETGWLVPDFLRNRWELELGDSVAGIASRFQTPPASNHEAKQPENPVDLFFHDSLHTFDHLQAEIHAIESHLSSDAILLADNMEMASGAAFNSYCRHENTVSMIFGNLGGVRLCPPSGLWRMSLQTR